MKLKVNGSALDFTADIDVERKVKLFEDAASTDGDLSFPFDIPITSRNLQILGITSINSSNITSRLPAIIENSGDQLYIGFIEIDRIKRRQIQVTFYSGNSNWMEDLDFKIRDFDMSSLDVDWNTGQVSSSYTNRTGIIFPVIDTGALANRSFVNWHIDELHPFIYVRTAIEYLLNRNGIKLTGDILNDWRFNRLITSNSDAAVPQEQINEREAYIDKTVQQTIEPTDPITPEVVTFNTVFNDPYLQGLWDTTNHRFTADEDMEITITYTVTVSYTDNNSISVVLCKNGTIIPYGGVSFGGTGAVAATVTRTKTLNGIKLSSGDYLDIRSFIPNVAADESFIESAVVRITPTRIYTVFANNLLPDVKASEFIASIFNLFNVVIDYDGKTKTMDVNIFKNIVRRQEIDISGFIDHGSIEIDTIDLAKSYGVENSFNYSDSEIDKSKWYNRSNVLPFGAGTIEGSSNSQPSVEIIASDFVAVMEDTTNPFNTFLPVVKWRELSNGISFESVPATNSGGDVVFTPSGFSNGDIVAGDIVRISDSTVDSYNGEWIVTTASSTTFEVQGLTYSGDATVNIEKLELDFIANGEQALLLAAPNYPVTSFTNTSTVYYADSGGVSSSGTITATAWFYKPIQGLTIDNYKHSLSFGNVNIPNAHQHNLIDDYWKDFEKIVQDPVKVIANGYFPKAIFDRLFSAPLRLKTSKFNCRFFLNKATGYKGKHLPCEVELIKL